MNPDIMESIMQHQWCQIKGVCVECKKPLGPDSLVCRRCSHFRYCSLQCQERGKPKHQYVCDMQHFFQQTYENDEGSRNMSIGRLFDMFLKFKQQEAYVNSNNMNMTIDSATKESVVSDSQVTNGSQCSIDRVSDSENQSGAGVSACNEAEGGSESFGKGWWGANKKHSSKKLKLEDKSKHVSCNDKVLGEKNASSQNRSTFNVNSHSASSQSKDGSDASSYGASNHSASSKDASRPSTDRPSASSQDASKPSASRPSADRSNASSQNASSHSASNHSASNHSASSQNKDSSSESNHGPRSQDTSGHSTDRSSTGSTNMATSNPANSSPSVSNTNGNPTSSQTSTQSKPDNFGSGWWQAKKPQTSNATSSPTDKLNPEESESKQQKQNSARNISSSPNALNSETSRNCGRTVASSETREQSNSNDFGSGWLKNQFLNNTKKETSRPTAKPEKDSISTKGTKTEVQHKNNNGSSEFVNKCTDVVPYKVFRSLEQILRLAKVVSHIDSVAVEEEALHGRVLMTTFSRVPGQWIASLGGSYISLLVEIVGRCFSSMLEILVRDKNGHTARVLIQTESSMYSVPGSVMKIPYKMCTKPGNFVVLRAVSWEQLPSGKLVIVMRDIKNVDFIFDAALDL